MPANITKGFEMSVIVPYIFTEGLFPSTVTDGTEPYSANIRVCLDYVISEFSSTVTMIFLLSEVATMAF